MPKIARGHMGRGSFQPVPVKFSRDMLCGLILLVGLFLVYLPVWHAGFIWDDDYYITKCQPLRSWDGLWQIWFNPAATVQYYPLTFTSFWLEYHLWQANPLGYHLDNLLLHAGNALLLWQLLRKLGVRGAWLGAALFALHPVSVESVAWATERKNTLSGFFYLSSLLAAVEFWNLNASFSNPGPEASTGSLRRWKFFWLALFLYLAALLSKSATIPLPAVILLLLWWKRPGLGLRDLYPLLPFVGLGFAMGCITVWVEKHYVGATGTEWDYSWPQRCILIGRTGWFYLGKLAWPHPISFVYRRWDIDASQPFMYVPSLAGLAALAFLWLKREAPFWRPVFVAAVYFVLLLLPVCGIISIFFFQYSYVADHFQYLASMGPLALAGAGLSKLADAVFPSKAWLRQGLGVGFLLVLGTLSWQRIQVYRNEESLWADTLAQNPGCWLAYSDMGQIVLQKGRVDDALAYYQRALALNPESAEGHYDVGLVLFQKGKIADAIAQYQDALAIRSDFVLARIDLGWAFSQSGRPEEGMAQYQKALETNPHYGLAHYYVGLALQQKGRSDEATAQFQQAVTDDPSLFEAHYNLGLALLTKGRLNESIQQFEDALSINPSSPDAHNNLGLALTQNGRLPEAIGELQRALQLAPALLNAHYNLGNAYLRVGQLNAAIAEFQTVVQQNPDFAGAHNNLAIALFQSGRMDESVAQFREVVRITPGDLNAQSNLVKAQALAQKKAAAGK
jgi:tetratricopeptide (TPR) repeat protein